jgi:hypothetical protein
MYATKRGATSAIFQPLAVKRSLLAKASVLFACQPDWGYYVAAIQDGGSYESQPFSQNPPKSSVTLAYTKRLRSSSVQHCHGNYIRGSNSQRARSI